MSGDGLRDTCCPDLWDRINELESQLTAARATITELERKRKYWMRETERALEAKADEAKATIAKQQALMNRVVDAKANYPNNIICGAEGELAKSIDDMTEHLKEKQNA